jgi:DHA2 family multidrug resistance protein
MSEESATKSSVLITLLVIYGTLFISIFNYTLNIISSIYITSDLGGGSSTVTYSISFFALGNVLGIPLGGYLLAKWGVRRPMIFCTILFTFLALSSALASTYYEFIMGRLLQGLVCGPYYGLILSLQNLIFPPKYKRFILPLDACIFIVTPTLGACWGGWISYEWDWRILYYIEVPIAAILAILQYFYIKGYDTSFYKKNVVFDFIGYLSFACALVSLSFVVIRGQELDWFRSHLITRLFVFGLFSLLFFILWELKTQQPLLNIRLLSNLALAFCLLHLAFLFALYFGNIILLSLWLKFWANYTPWWINLLLLNTALAALAIIILRSKIVLVDCRVFWSIAILFLGISCYYTTYFNIEIDFKRIAISRLFAGFGLAFFLPPIFRMAYGLYPEKYIDILGLLQVMRALGSGLGASIFSTIWGRRQVFFNERLVSRLTPFSPLTDQYFANAQIRGLHGEMATAQLDYFSQREASSLALNDSFYLMFWILALLLLSFSLTYFLPKKAFNPH